ncbi:YesL family protein [Alteribacillus sp. HJP-4]|uniref:YesL family protein n=1 Tax=Alteribacillus sp. HJP-4 TaxID=2775394 RepID=UPI0035CD0832
MNRITSHYIRFGEWALHLFLTNLLWVLFSALGLFVFGVFPATAALFAVLRTRIVDVKHEKSIPVIKQFWHHYKREFLRANLIGWMLTAAGFVLYVNVRVLQQLDASLINQMITIITYLLIFVYVLVLLYIFPLFVHFKLSTRQYVTYAFVMAIGKPLQTLSMIILLAGSIYVFVKVPGLIPVFGGSVLGFIMMKMTSYSLPEKSSFSQMAQQ